MHIQSRSHVVMIDDLIMVHRYGVGQIQAQVLALFDHARLCSILASSVAMPDPLPDQAAVRCNIAAYAQPRDVIISFRITRALADSIDNFSSMHHKKNRTEAIIDLLQIALYITDNASKLQDPTIVKYLQENLYNVQLVDDIMEWPQDRIEAISGDWQVRGIGESN